MAVEIYTMNKGTEYQAHALTYVNSDICIKIFSTKAAAEKYANKNGYSLVK